MHQEGAFADLPSNRLDEIATLSDLVESTEFLLGVAGAVFALAALIVFRRDAGRSGWGIALTAAVGLGLFFSNAGLPRSVPLGIGTLGLGGGLFGKGLITRPSAGDRLGLVTIAIGATLLAYGMRPNQSTWVLVLAPPITVGMALAIRSWRDLPLHRHLGIVTGVTAFGIWATVPDTEAARVLLGAAMVLSVATYAPLRARISSGGAFSLSGMVVWISATGGVERPGSIIGAWACVGLLVLAPVLWNRLAELSTALVLSGHAIWVLLSSRVFGFFQSALAAALWVVALTGVTVGLVSLITPEWLRSTS